MLLRFCLYGFLKNQRYFEPFLVLAFLEQGLGFSAIGVLIAVRSLTVNLLEIPSGAIADTWGRRGSMIASFVAYIVSFVLFAFGSGMVWFVLAMVAYGVGESFRTGTHKAMIFEWLRLQGREDERTRIYGLTRSWSKIGSAVSAIVAAALVILSGNYRAIFLFATIPYLLSIVNFLGYPAELDGRADRPRPRTLGETRSALFASLSEALRRRSLRRLMQESMSWEGVFHSVKDYIQPVLAAAVVGLVVLPGLGAEATTSTAITVAAFYTLLFLLSAAASRSADRFAEWRGGEESAARDLWLLGFLSFAALGVFAWYGRLWLVAVMFVVMNVLQNVWRPILIGRFNEHTDPQRGATVLSIESQSQRLVTMIVAPLLGLWIDRLGSGVDARYWPIGVVGAVAALAMWATATQTRKPTRIGVKSWHYT